MRANALRSQRASEYTAMRKHLAELYSIQESLRAQAAELERMSLSAKWRASDLPPAWPRNERDQTRWDQWQDEASLLSVSHLRRHFQLREDYRSRTRQLAEEKGIPDSVCRRIDADHRL